jgi:hypothetical protein
MMGYPQGPAMKNIPSRSLVFLFVFFVFSLPASCFAGTTDAVDPSVVRADNVEFWEEVEWADMTPSEQDLWIVLGWSRSSWDEEGPEPESENKSWSGLSKEERAAAHKLGFDKRTWDQ